MTTPEIPEPEPLPANIPSIQPGGGTIQSLELLWGRLRRRLLKTFRPGYVREMKAKLQGDPSTCPVEVIDSRDLKFHHIVCDCGFRPEDDRFAWRSRLPFARAGFAELLIFGGTSGLLTVIFAMGVAGSRWWAVIPGALAAFVIYFFRDPQRKIPEEPGVVVSPADGWVVDIEEIQDPEFIGEPALKIGIFLSVFNVHVNRISLAARVIRMRYEPGKFLNALYPSSAKENERMEVFFVEPTSPHRRFIIRQIAGAIARRIVCEIRPGQVLKIGERFGMIKFGSRTELLLPKKDFEILVQVGSKVHGGATRLGRYRTGIEE